MVSGWVGGGSISCCGSFFLPALLTARQLETPVRETLNSDRFGGKSYSGERRSYVFGGHEIEFALSTFLASSSPSSLYVGYRNRDGSSQPIVFQPKSVARLE